MAVTCFAPARRVQREDVGAFRRRWDECGGFDGSEKQVVVAARGAVDVDALDDVRQRIVGGALRGGWAGGGSDARDGDRRLADQHDGRRRGGRASSARGKRGGAGFQSDSAVAVARRRRGVRTCRGAADVVLRRLEASPASLSDFDTTSQSLWLVERDASLSPGLLGYKIHIRIASHINAAAAPARTSRASMVRHRQPRHADARAQPP